MKVLCVAEKPSIARSITSILSGGAYETRNSRNHFIKNFDFDYPQTRSRYTVTSVAGHVMEHDFAPQYRGWNSCEPFALFDAPVEERVPQGNKTIEENLMREARNAEELMIWTDCDREGEHIGSEIKKICRKSNPRIRVTRARFSAIIAQQIHRAAQNPVALDQAQADAVETRIMLDLRIGAAFTRMQTLNLQRRFNQIAEAGKPISYGPCQFPTLGFVVSRYDQVQTFAPEDFWYIFMSLSRPNVGGQANGAEETTVFNWRRGHIFEQIVVEAIFDALVENPAARVTKKTSKPTKKWKPLPLTTVELQKAGSRLLHLAPKRVLDVAEKLYQQGYLSYPRTETDQFDNQFDFNSLIEKQTHDNVWGGFATQLLNGGFQAPRKGQKNDHAHPPIHPTKYAGNLEGDEKRVYEFVTRRFLACCHKDAEGQETTVEVVCGGEYFSASGLIVLARNYLDVYTYDKWAGKFLPNFEEGEQFRPTVCEIREGQTSCPNLLTEADLVTLMDKNGIGTDATIAQHIQTITDREYVLERMEGATKFLVPSTLGIGLVEGYNEIGFEKSLSKPQLRRDTERLMVDICERTKSKAAVLDQSIEQYKEVYIRARQEFDKIYTSVARYIEGANRAAQDRPARRGRGRGRGAAVGGRGGRPPPGDDGDDNAGGGSGGRGRGSGRGRVQGRSKTTTVEHDADDSGAKPKRARATKKARATEEDVILLDEPPMPPSPPPPKKEKPIAKSKPPASASSSTSQIPKPNAASRPNATAPAGLNCHCGYPVAIATVTNNSHKFFGRQYWACGHSNFCDFFEWIDGPSHKPASSVDTSVHPQTLSKTKPVSSVSTATAHSTVMRASNITNRPSNSERVCKCGLEAELKVMEHKGTSSGRRIWKCPKSENKCSYFDFEDGVGFSADNTKSDACFNCGQPGHWSSSCPEKVQRNENQHSGVSRSNPSSGLSCYRCGEEGHFANSCTLNSVNQSATDDRCYKCDQTGHRSNACPQAQVSQPATGSCFKCGEAGHYANACPDGNAPRQGTQSQATGTQMTCFKCDQTGHFANACPQSVGGKKKTTSRTTSRTTSKTSTSKRGRSGSSKSESKRKPRSKSQFAAADGY